MDMDLRGRVETNISLAASNFLLPLFEAVMNSMQAVEERGAGRGRITVRIVRDTTQKVLDESLKSRHPIDGFVIEDDGVGFTERNYKSFRTADSLHKKARGGKGVGRLYWLKAFAGARIESTYCDGDQYRRRTFDFALTRKGVKNHTLVEAEPGDVQTTVTLHGYRPEYKAKCWKQFDTLGRKIIEHFLAYFALDNCPEIELVDEQEGSRVSLNRVFREQMRIQSRTEQFEFQGRTFTIEHFRILTTAANADHQIHLCAGKRSVETEDLSKLLVDLSGALHDPEKDASFAYAGYLSGDLLDTAVSQDRTRFDMPEDETLFAETDEPTIQSLVRGVAREAEKFLSPFLEPRRQQKMERIRAFAQNTPRYRHLLKLRPEWVEQIRSDIKDEDLDLELYKLARRLEGEVRQEGAKLQREQRPEVKAAVEVHKKRFSNYLTELNAVGLSKLSEYVIHRRATLDFLSSCMGVRDDGKYPLEDVIHEVVFPMKATSDDVPDPDQTNLWLIDERLAYHFYLASDLQFGQIEPLEVDGKARRDRMDLFVLRSFDRPVAFAETSRPHNSITIVEFKRPQRDDYIENDDSKDPVAQVWKYVRTIRSGKLKDKNGEFLRPDDRTPFYCYIICSLTPKLVELAEGHSFTPMPDGQGFYYFHPNLRAYTEILSFEKMLGDARKRNQIFFDKFDLPAFR